MGLIDPDSVARGIRLAVHVETLHLIKDLLLSSLVRHLRQECVIDDVGVGTFDAFVHGKEPDHELFERVVSFS